MKAILGLLIVFLISFTSAEIVIVEQEKTYEHPLFTIDTSEGILLTANYDFTQVYVYLDGQQAHSLSSMSKGAVLNIAAQEGTRALELKALVSLDYVWDSFDLLKDDEPVKWAFLNYDRNRKRIIFALTGVDFVHPNDLSRTGRSVNNVFEDHTITFNGAQNLVCYTKITTGSDMGFTCNNVAYPNSLSLELSVGVMETHSVEVMKSISKNIAGSASQTPPQQQAAQDEPITSNNEEEVVEEDYDYEAEFARADNIIISDTIPQQGLPGGITALIIVCFIAFFYLLFVASHHKYENKLAGKLHPHKKKQQQKSPIQKASQPVLENKDKETNNNLPRYAPDPVEKENKK